jgi:thiol:disulfide interchange protein
MRPLIFAAQATAFADEFEQPLAQLFEFMEPAPDKWADQLADWCVLCRTEPEDAFAEDTVAQVLETLVSLMHTRMSSCGVRSL